MGLDRAAVHLHQRLADRQPQAQAAELPRDRAFRLLEGVEDPRQRLRLDADPAVVHLDDHVLLVRPAADAHAAAVRRELDRVLQEVPEDLLEPGRVGLDPVGRGRPQVHAEVQPPGLDVGLADLDRPLDDRAQLDGAAGVSSIFPRAIRVTSSKSSISRASISTLRRTISSVSRTCRVEVRPVLEHRHAHHHRRQGRAQLVAEDRQEMVLGAVGLLGGGLGLLGGVLAACRASSARLRSVTSTENTSTPVMLPHSS